MTDEELRDKIQIAIGKRDNQYPSAYARTSDGKGNLHIWMIDTRKASQSVIELLKELNKDNGTSIS